MVVAVERELRNVPGARVRTFKRQTGKGPGVGGDRQVEYADRKSPEARARILEDLARHRRGQGGRVQRQARRSSSSSLSRRDNYDERLRRAIGTTPGAYRTALHEAAHAVMALKEGVTVRAAGLYLQRCPDGRERLGGACAYADGGHRTRVVSLAGAAAELCADYWDAGPSYSDLRASDGRYTARELDEVRKVVSWNWDAIQLVAEHLMKRGEMTGNEIKRLLAARPKKRYLL